MAIIIVDKAHADHVIDIGRQTVTNIDIIETADIDTINAWVASPDMMRINPANLAEINFWQSPYSIDRGSVSQRLFRGYTGQADS